MSTSTPKRGQLSFLPDEKKCSGCKKVLPVTEFYPAKERSDGRRAYCISCQSPIRSYYELKKRARKKRLPMEVTAEYIKNIYPDDMICPVFGIKMTIGLKRSSSPSIDRIIPEKGYVPGNVIIVSMKANQIKSNATPDEIIKVGKFYKKLLEEMEDGSETD